MVAIPTPRIDLLSLQHDAQSDGQSRLVLADWHEEQNEADFAELLRDPVKGPIVARGLGRPDVMRIWLRQQPQLDVKRRKRIDSMTDGERARMADWAKKWIAIGLSTERADRPMFEAGIVECYRHAGLGVPRVVWTSAPIVAALAGPIAAHMLYGIRDAIDDAIDDAVRGAVHGAVRGAVGDAVRDAIDDAVRGAVGDAVDGAVRRLDPSAIRQTIQNLWWRYMGGQFWVGGWYWGSPSYVSFMLDALGLDIGKDMELRARSYAAVCSSACWVWPGRDFVIVSERPTEIKLKRDGQLKRAVWDLGNGETWTVGK